MKHVPPTRWCLALLSAALQLVPFPIAGPVPLWRRELCWLCLVPLLLALLRHGRTRWMPSVRQGAAVGYVCGGFFYVGNCYWIYQTMYLYGRIAKPIALGVLVLFALYLGLYLGLFGACVAALQRRLGTGWALLLSPFVWVAVELARDRITGFPWDLLGYSLVDGGEARWLAPMAGVMGLSLVVAAVNALLVVPCVALQPAGAGKSRTWWLAVATPALVAAMWWSRPLATMSQGAALQGASQRAVLVQDNRAIGDEVRGPLQDEAALFADLAGHSLAAERQPTAVILWPEAPTPFEDNDPVFRAQMSALARRAMAPVIADDAAFDLAPGTPSGYHLHGSASVFGGDGSYVGRYDKIHLVPFGEYVPYRQIFFFAGSLLDQVGLFEPGHTRSVFQLGGEGYGVFICYESIFGDEVRHFALNGANVLVNLSDDGWYGNTAAPWQHLDMVRMRAIENHRWILRATNTGISAAISPSGEVTQQMPRQVRDAMSVNFGFESGTTFYTRHGDWIGWLCAAVACLALVLGLLLGRVTNRLSTQGRR